VARLNAALRRRDEDHRNRSSSGLISLFFASAPDVHHSVTGRERQRIISIAQRLLQMSADGRGLLTAAIDGGDLRLYRVQP
jgi:hypothetical protein